jgi:hypothetical protein
MRIAAYVVGAWLVLSVPVCVVLALLLAGAKLRPPTDGYHLSRARWRSPNLGDPYEVEPGELATPED